MPRNPKGGGSGGKRVGTPGVAYSNRSDLNKPQPHTIAQSVPTGQEYGKAAQEKASLAAIPMASGPIGVGAAQGPQAQGVPDPTQAPAYTGPTPGSLPDLFGPTNNPNEHFMTGVNAGPGQDASALGPNPFADNQAPAILATLQSIPNPSPQVQFYKYYLQALADNQAPASTLGH